MIISKDEIIFDDRQQEKEVKEISNFYNSLPLATNEGEQREKEYLDKLQKESEIIDF